MLTPLEDSKIKVIYESGFQKIIIPQPSGGIFRFFVGVFLFFWLGGWAVGWKSAVSEFFNSNGPTDAFLIVWLCVWTICGILVIWILFKIFRSSIPESIVLSTPNMFYDSGVTPFRISFRSLTQRDFWKKLFQRRVKKQIEPSQLKTISLRNCDTGNRLTIDQGKKRFDLATGATEQERKWLFKVLKNYYHS